MTLIEVQEWSMPDPPKADVELCDCGHDKGRHQMLNGACAACPNSLGIPLCKAFTPTGKRTESTGLDDVKAMIARLRDDYGLPK